MPSESMLKCFMAVSETLNFTKAAEALFMTQQAVSRNISVLEEELQMKLLIRDTHSVRLTPCGENYYQVIKRLMDEYLREVGAIKTQYGDSMYVLRIGIVDAPDFRQFQEAFYHYQLTQPHQIALDVKLAAPDELLDLIHRGELDAILTMDCFVDDASRMESVSLKDAYMKLAVSKQNHLFGSGTDWKDFAGEPLIVQTAADTHLYEADDFMHSMIKHLGLTPSAIVLMGDGEKMKKLVEDGWGVNLCLTLNPRLDAENISLMEISDHPVHYFLSWKEDTDQETISRIRLFADYLLSWEPSNIT